MKRVWMKKVRLILVNMKDKEMKVKSVMEKEKQSYQTVTNMKVNIYTASGMDKALTSKFGYKM